nr:hypothetical protein BCU38_23365 [Vibrio splendidus]
MSPLILSDELKKSKQSQEEENIRPTRNRAGVHVFLALVLTSVLFLFFMAVNCLNYPYLGPKAVYPDVCELKVCSIQHLSKVGTIMVGISVVIQAYTHWLTLNPLVSAVRHKVSKYSIFSCVIALVGTILCLWG